MDKRIGYRDLFNERMNIASVIVKPFFESWPVEYVGNCIEEQIHRTLEKAFLTRFIMTWKGVIFYVDPITLDNFGIKS